MNNRLFMLSLLSTLCITHISNAQQKINHAQSGNPTHAKVQEPKTNPLITATALETASKTLDMLKDAGWNPSLMTQVQWFEKGILGKYLVQQAEDLYVKKTIQPYEDRLKKIDTDIANLSAKKTKKNAAKIAQLEQQKKELTATIKTMTDDTKMFAVAAGKFIEANMKQSIEAYLKAQAPANYAEVMKAAFGSGLKVALLSDVSTTLITTALDEIKKQTKPATLQWDWYPYAPLTATHSTAIYCGPKDPYCLHGAKQLDVNETLNFIAQNLGATAQSAAINLTTILTAYASSTIGATIGNLPKTLGSVFSTLAQETQIHWLIDLIKNLQPAAKALDPLLRGIQRYAETYIPVKVLQTLTTLFDDLNLQLTDEQKKNLKKEFITTAKAKGLYAGSEDFVKFIANLEATA